MLTSTCYEKLVVCGSFLFLVSPTQYGQFITKGKYRWTLQKGAPFNIVRFFLFPTIFQMAIIMEVLKVVVR